MKKESYFISMLVPFFLFTSLAWFHEVGANKVEDRIKESIGDVADFLKKEVDVIGNDITSIQNYLENYHWKGIIQDSATSGAETLSKLRLNGHTRVVVVKPNTEIEGVVECSLNSEEVSSLKVYRAVIGIAGLGPQAVVGKMLGISPGETLETFSLSAPNEPGLYEVRFRTADCFLEHFAFDAWNDENGNEPDGTTTIGIIYVIP